jgi:signal transduction histidine kinase
MARQVSDLLLLWLQNMSEFQEHILVVSSASQIDQQLSRLFQSSGSAVTCVAGLPDALDWAANHPVSLAIFEIQTRAGQSVEEISAFSETYPQIPVLLCLDEETPALMKQGLRAGAVGFFPASWSADEGIPVVNHVLDRVRRQKEREADLQRQIDEMAHVVEDVSNGIIVVDRNLRLKWVNRAAIDAFGLNDVDDWQGKPLLEVFPQPGLSDLFEIRDSLNCSSTINVVEIPLGEHRVFSVRAVESAGVGWVLTLQDITQQKKLDQIKSDIMHTISHDLRSPLTVILGYVDLVERVGPVNDLQKEFIRRSRSSVHNVTRLVDNLLQLARIESDFDVCKEPLDIRQVLERAVDGFKKQFADKNLRVQLDLPEDLPMLAANSTQIRHMVENLLDNAVKYSVTDGEVKVAAWVEGEQLVLQFHDTGIGIPPDEIPWVFDRFYRASNVGAEISGTGLGLAIVQVIVTNHEGRVWIESTLNEGTTVSVLLPYPKTVSAPDPQ